MSTDEELPKKLMKGYLDALENGRNEEAASYFTEDVIYRHPLIDEVHGREALVEFFDEREQKDGAKGVHHSFDEWVIGEHRFAVLGTMSGARGTDRFVSYVELDGEKISLYSPGLQEGVWRDER